MVDRFIMLPHGNAPPAAARMILYVGVHVCVYIHYNTNEIRNGEMLILAKSD